MTLYGIQQCDSVRKAKKWLQAQGMDIHFHDFRRDGIDQRMISVWLQTVPTQRLLNTRSTTWKQLSEAERTRAETNLPALLQQYPTLIKRPVLVVGEHVLVGFDEASYRHVFHQC